MSDKQSSRPAPYSPPHSIRFSRKARRVSLRVLPGKGLEVVLPPHTDPACVPALLVRHQVWIEKTLRRMRDAENAGALPGAFFIKGGAELVRIVPLPPHAGRRLYEAASPPCGREAAVYEGPMPATALTRPPEERFLCVPAEADAARKTRLRGWVRDEAARWLVPELDGMAERLGLRFSAVRFRFQKSRWGSCSVKGNINLNACLLFLPERLARYIVLHELCHLRQMNHGEAFWKLVFAADPDALAKDAAMRGAWRHVPGWVWA